MNFRTTQMRAIGFFAAVLFLCGSPRLTPAANVVAIGDSLTAEYETVPDVPGFPNEASRYAEVTVPGWESMSWVEVAGRLLPKDFNFGAYRKLSAPWMVPRLSGYEFNWGIPGINASQYKDFVTSSRRDNFAYFVFRQPLEEQLRSRAERAVIWLGTNEFRANYGPLYDGGSSDVLIEGLVDDLGRIVDFVKKTNPRLQIVVANIPDLGVTPSKKAAHPDPTKRARVTVATMAANARLAELVAAKGVVLADVYSRTARLVEGEPTYFGAVEMIDDEDADNNPRYLFTRDGLHPNTPLQIELARVIIDAFNRGYSARIPQITDAQALELLGIDPNQPYFDWLAAHGIAKRGFKADLDGDRITSLVEYAFGMNPAEPDADSLPATIGGPVSGFSGDISINYTADPQRVRHVRVRAQYSTDQITWKSVPATNVIANPDGSFIAVVPSVGTQVYTRLKVAVIPPSGSATSTWSSVQFE